MTPRAAYRAAVADLDMMITFTPAANREEYLIRLSELYRDGRLFAAINGNLMDLMIDVMSPD